MRRLALAVLLLAALPAAPAAAHQGNPNYRSIVHGITPRVPGLSVSVVNYDDHFLVHNASGRTVVVKGYDGEPYIRFEKDGTVQVNHNSPAYYLNVDRFGGASVPATANAKAAPNWQTVTQNGTYEWHDHRMHWMGKNVPPQVKNKNKTTKIFDYKVPLTAGGTPAHIAGTLFWKPEPGGGPPLSADIVLGLFTLAMIAFAIVVRRRRRGAEDGGTAEPPAPKEAW